MNKSQELLSELDEASDSKQVKEDLSTLSKGIRDSGKKIKSSEVSSLAHTLDGIVFELLVNGKKHAIDKAEFLKTKIKAVPEI